MDCNSTCNSVQGLAKCYTFNKRYDNDTITNEGILADKFPNFKHSAGTFYLEVTQHRNSHVFNKVPQMAGISLLKMQKKL